ncbi:MAG TPA: MOSC N-terminal beta barrel domain-containing protein [Actinomycetota bacterium]|nr:MOSC N-terminal beta barrel domain-containing protein [Actinomycetota bacterium]
MIGRVVSLWRYPVKSMQGEVLDAAFVGERGLIGDRAFALLDVETSKIASAKSPRMWPNLLDFYATYVEPPRVDDPLPPVRITLPDGGHVRSDDATVEDVLSQATGRKVRLISSNPKGATFEYYVPDVDGVDPRGSDFYTDFANDLFGTGSLHDSAPIHLLTTATLGQLRSLYPQGQFDPRRFRPNLVIEPTEDQAGFVENVWLKRVLSIGQAHVRITFPMLRCVMTTLPQAGLPRDVGILRTAARHNRLQVLNIGEFPCIGVGGLVRQPGMIRGGDSVAFADDKPFDEVVGDDGSFVRDEQRRRPQFNSHQSSETKVDGGHHEEVGI